MLDCYVATIYYADFRTVGLEYIASSRSTVIAMSKRVKSIITLKNWTQEYIGLFEISSLQNKVKHIAGPNIYKNDSKQHFKIHL